MNLLEVEHLRKTFGQLVAVADVSFAVAPGEVLGLLGPNGAGKSTTMMMLAGLLKPDSGSIRLDGHPFDPHDYRDRVMLGVVPQDLAVYPELTARENLDFFGRLYKVFGAALEARIKDVLERIGLTSRADDKVGEYSGGMKRRLNFGVALLHQPRLLILDEPTVGVDPQSRAHLLDSVRDLASEGMGVIYASHYMEEVQAICQRVAIVDRGRMLAYDTIEALLARLSAKITLHVSSPPAELRERLHGLAAIESPNGKADAVLVISRDKGMDEQALNARLAKVIGLLNDYSGRLLSIETHDPNLERLFLELTGNRLRD